MEANLEKGDIAYLDYDLWVVGPGEAKTLHETTHEDVAKAADKYDEKKSYAAIPVAVGHERLPKGLDEAILGLAVGETKEVVIPPGKGAGERDPKLVRLYPIREFHKKEIDPAPGLEVHLDGRHGTVMAVTAGRVRVDFNNPLAGRTLQYKVTITKRAETPEERIRGVLEMDYGLGDQFKIFVKEGGEADIFLPDVCKTDERWFVSKFRVVADLREFAGIAKVRFVEEYEKKEEKAESPAEAKAETPAKEKKVAAPKRATRPKEPPKAKAKGKGKGPKDERAEEELPPEDEKAPEEL
ncbi:MAG TPA: FKBP-type peptidyl-prolyl cis-trans isomerase [Thermoplasmata archaeon]|jgi:FKBP-type peptidyl-prolyl cis-trans isomerase 2|nr:FKBP-type peptidyl-prolyl cis-trans isomerase [Thermoplasmata archaeon]